MCSIDYPSDVWIEAFVRARKRHVCCECGGEIPAGVRYAKFHSLMDGHWDTYKMHYECRVLWGSAAGDLCGQPGFVLTGGLSEELSEYGAHAAQTDDELAAEWDGAVPNDVLRAMPYRRRFEAIKAKYADAA